MSVALYAIMIVGGVGLFTWSYVRLTRANPQTTIPQWFGRPENHPRGLHFLRGAGIFLLILGAISLSNDLELGSLGVGLLAFICIAIPGVAIVTRHNLRVKREGQHHDA